MSIDTFFPNPAGEDGSPDYDPTQYLKTQVVEPIGGYTYTALEPQWTARKRVKEKWFNCPKCGFSYPRSQGVLIQGSYYCTVLGDAEDKKAEIKGL